MFMRHLIVYFAHFLLQFVTNYPLTEADYKGIAQNIECLLMYSEYWIRKLHLLN